MPKRGRGHSNRGSKSANPTHSKRGRYDRAGTTSEMSSNQINEYPDALRLILDGFEQLKERIGNLENTRNTTPSVEEASTSSLPTSDIATVSSVVSPTISEQPTYVLLNSCDRPKFTGELGKNPIRFLNSLRSYIKTTNSQNRALEIAKQCLSGGALSILSIYKDKWKTLDDFENSVKEIYWDLTAQERAKSELGRSVYDYRAKISMVQHFCDQFATVEATTIAFSDSEKVNIIMKQFPLWVQRLWFSRQIEVTTISAVNFLRGLENNLTDRGEVGPRRDNRFVARRQVNTIVRSQRGGNTRRGRGGRFNRNYISREKLLVTNTTRNFNGRNIRAVPAIQFERSEGNTTSSNGENANKEAGNS